MAAMESAMMPLGTQAPAFELPDVIEEKLVSLDNLKIEKGLVVMFICAHCPYVQHIQEELAFLAEKYSIKGIQFVGISSNNIDTHPEDAPHKLKKQAEEFEFNFPYLFDESQEVAMAYGAVCTPDFFLFDTHLKCVYRGRFDGSTPGNEEPVTGVDLKEALEALIDGESINPDQKPSMGCSIKWK